VSEARASRIAEELAETDNVSHERDPIDRRQVRLHVTPAAKDRALRIYEERTAALHAALADASDTDLKIFARCMERIVEEFEALATRAGTASCDQSAISTDSFGSLDGPPKGAAGKPLARE
jgi:hypothetical protein